MEAGLQAALAGEVVDVVDGDTIKVHLAGGVPAMLGAAGEVAGEVAGGVVSVRLIGIDTPETRHPSKPVQCLGPEATARAVELADGQHVRLELDATQGATDRYGRTLAYVWLDDGRMLNEEMVAEGLAREYTYDAAYRHQGRMLAAQRSARSSALGLWEPGRCDPGA